MKLRVVPGALSLIPGVVSPVWSPSRQPRRQRPSPPTGINNNHEIAGVSVTASGYSHAVMWSNGTMTDLGTFGLDPVGEAINNHGVIVGQSSLRAWIWSGGVFQNLNNLIPPGCGFTLDNTTAINDNGQVVASGFDAPGQRHAFLVTPS